MHGVREDDHTYEPYPGLDHRPFGLPEFLTGEVRNQPIGNTHEAEGYSGCHGEVEVTGDEGGVVQHKVDVIRSIRQTADTTEEEQDASQKLSRDGGVVPIQFADPAECTLAALLACAHFEGGDHGEGGHHGGEEHTEGQHGVDELPNRGNAGIHILVVEAKRSGEYEEDPEGETGERVAEHLAVGCLFGKHGIPGDVRRQEPEIHQGVTGEPEVSTGKLRIYSFNKTKRPGQQHGEDFNRHTKRTDLPEHKSNERSESNEGSAFGCIFLAPAKVSQEQAPTFNPRTDHNESQAKVERPIGFEGRIEGEEHSGFVGEDRDRSGDHTDNHEPKTNFVQNRVLERAFETEDHIEGQETHDEEGCPNQRVQHAMNGKTLIVGFDERFEILIEIPTGVFKGLQRTEQTTDRKSKYGDQNVGADKFLFGGGNLILIHIGVSLCTMG